MTVRSTAPRSIGAALQGEFSLQNFHHKLERLATKVDEEEKRHEKWCPFMAVVCYLLCVDRCFFVRCALFVV